MLQIEDGEALEIQCTRPGNSLVQEPHCVVLNVGPVADGAVREWGINSGQLRLSFTETAQRALEMPRTIACALGQEGQKLVEEHLPRILRH